MSRPNGAAYERFDAAGFEVPFAVSFEGEALSDSEATFEAESESPFGKSTFEAESESPFGESTFEAEDFDSESLIEAGAWSGAQAEEEAEDAEGPLGEGETSLSAFEPAGLAAEAEQMGYDETLASLDTEAVDGNAEDEEESESPLGEAEGETALTAEQRAWILALDRTAIERLPDAGARARFLQQDWSDVEFPGNVPKGQVATDGIKRHWALARSLFNAMAGVVPERRVPTTIRFRDRPVVKVPGQTTHRLYGEARDAFVRMRDAARADGVGLVIVSSWRSRARQAAASANQPNPAAVARKASAHMYGLAIDLRMGVQGLPVKETNTRVDRATAAKVGTTAKMGNLVRMYRSPVYKWMSLRADDFGWYPYRNEPWHWEYNPPGLKARFEGATRGELEQEGRPEAEYEEESETSSPFLRTFTAKALGVKVAVYVTQAARSAAQVELMLFAHGLDLCKPVFKNRPATFVTERPFKLGELVEATGRPIVLVVPFLGWERLSANRMAFGRKWHRLAQPAAFNEVAAEALEQARAITGSAMPSSVRRLILAGHSRAYGFFDALAHQHASPHMRTGALSRPTHVWALDTTYSAPIADWRAWMRSRQDLEATVVFRYGKYRTRGSTVVRELPTGVRGREFAKLATASNGRLTVIPVDAGKVSHCAIPATYLPRLLAALPAPTTSGEDEREMLDESFEDEDEAGLAAEAESEAEVERLTYDEALAWLDVEALTGDAAEAQEEEEESEAEAEWGAESAYENEAESYDESESESEAEAPLSESEWGEAEDEAEEEEEAEDLASDERSPALEGDSPRAKCPNRPEDKDEVTPNREAPRTADDIYVVPGSPLEFVVKESDRADEASPVFEAESPTNIYKAKIREALADLNPTRGPRNGFGAPFKYKHFNEDDWKAVPDLKMRSRYSDRGWQMLVLRKTRSPVAAIKRIVTQGHKWSLECAMFVQVIQLYALSQVDPVAYDRRWRNKGLQLRYFDSSGVRARRFFDKEKKDGRWRAWFTKNDKYGLYDINNTKWTTSRILGEMGVGSRLMWRNNLIPRSAGEDFRNENAVKVGPNQYRAFGFDTRSNLSEAQLSRLLADAGRSRYPGSNPGATLSEYARDNIFLSEAQSFRVK